MITGSRLSEDRLINHVPSRYSAMSVFPFHRNDSFLLNVFTNEPVNFITVGKIVLSAFA
jgi:hypothetical protein